MGFSVVKPQVPPRPNQRSLAMGKRRLALSDDDDDEEQERRVKKQKGAQQEEQGARVEEDVKPVGRVIRVDRKGMKKHYASFEFDGNVYELEDTVLMSAAEDQKPYVAIIKGKFTSNQTCCTIQKWEINERTQDITEDVHGNVMITGQWFYRPEEALKRGGGNWEAQDTREIFYSFHRDEVPAESVMHKCVIHFVPLHKQLPVRSEHPGFIVQNVYDTVEKKLWRLTDKDYDDRKQNEIDMLVEKTRERIGELPDIVLEDSSAKKNDYLKSKRNYGKNNKCPIDVPGVEPTTRLDKLAKAYGSCRSDVSNYHVILSKFKVLTGDVHRDKWLEKLLQGIQLVFSKDAVPMDDKHKSNGISSASRISGKSSALYTEPYGSYSDDGAKICWTDAVIPTITMLEKVTYEALGVDFQKYNQKMRQLDFNIKSNPLLARRLLNKELDPIALLTMSPDELKEGLTADERIIIEPERPEQIQMTDARCSRCMEKQVGVTDIIYAGGHRDRYQLECGACGYTWYASRDAISSLTTDAQNVTGNVGTASQATANFETVEKKLVSPRKSQADAFKKSTDAYFSALETQKSFSKSKTEDPSSAAKR